MHRPTCGKCPQCTSHPNPDDGLAPCPYPIPPDYYLLLEQHSASKQQCRDSGFKVNPVQEVSLHQDIKQEFDITLFQGASQTYYLGEEPQSNKIDRGCISSSKNPSSSYGSNKSRTNIATNEGNPFLSSSLLSSVLDDKAPLPPALLVSPPSQDPGPPFALPAEGQRSQTQWHQDIQLPLQQQAFDHLPRSYPNPCQPFPTQDHSQLHWSKAPDQIMAPPLHHSGEGNGQQSTLAADALQSYQEKYPYDQVHCFFERPASMTLGAGDEPSHEPFPGVATLTSSPLPAPPCSGQGVRHLSNPPSVSTGSFCYFTMHVAPAASETNIEGVRTPCTPFGTLTLSAGGSENLQGLERTAVDRPLVSRHNRFQSGSNDHQFLVRPIPHRLSAPARTQVHGYIQQPQQPLYPENSQNIHYETPSCQQPELPQSTPCNSVYPPFSVPDGTVAHVDMIQGMHVAFESEGQSLTAYGPVSALAAFPTGPVVASPTVDYTSFPHDIQPGIIVGEDSSSYPRKRRSPSSQPISLPLRRSSSVSPLPPSLMEYTGMAPGLTHSESTTSTVASARDLFSPLSLENMPGMSSFPSKPQQQWQQIQQMPRAALAPAGVSRANGSQRGLARMHSSPDLQLQHHRPMATFSHSLGTYLDSAYQSSSSTASTVTFLSAPINLPSYSISHAKVFPASFPLASSPHQVPELDSELQRDPSLPPTQLPLQSPSGSSVRSMVAGRGTDKRYGLKSSGSKSDGDTDPSIPLLARKKQKQKQSLPLLPRMKKPCNSYMWYRKETYKKNQSDFNAKKFPGSAISKEIARAWKREPESVKRVFEAMAEMEKYNIMQAFPSYEFKSSQAGRKASRPRKKATAGLPLIMEMPMTLPDASSTSALSEGVVNGPRDSIATCSSGDRQKTAGQPDVYIIDDDRTESKENGSAGSNNQTAADQGAANTAMRTRVINVDHPPERPESQPQQGSTATTTFLSPPIVATIHQQQRHQQLAQFQMQHQQQLQLQNGYPSYRLYAHQGPDHNHDEGNVRNEPAGNDNQGSSPSSATDPPGRRKRKN